MIISGEYDITSSYHEIALYTDFSDYDYIDVFIRTNSHVGIHLGEEESLYTKILPTAKTIDAPGVFLPYSETAIMFGLLGDTETYTELGVIIVLGAPLGPFKYTLYGGKV